jgi:hypothetical protein
MDLPPPPCKFNRINEDLILPAVTECASNSMLEAVSEELQEKMKMMVWQHLSMVPGRRKGMSPKTVLFPALVSILVKSLTLKFCRHIVRNAKPIASNMKGNAVAILKERVVRWKLKELNE